MQLQEKRHYSPTEYLELELISEYRHEYQYSKTDENKWIFSEHEEEIDILTLSSIQFQITLSDIYDKVDFEAKE